METSQQNDENSYVVCPRCKEQVPLTSFIPQESMCKACLQTEKGSASVLRTKIVLNLLGILTSIGVIFTFLTTCFILLFEL